MTETDDQLLAEANDIMDKFDDASEGDPYGWDWPTMAVLEPEKVGRYRQIREELKARGRLHPVPGRPGVLQYQPA